MSEIKHRTQVKEQYLANRLYQLRMEHFLNQDVIAEIVGIATITYGRYERRERPIPSDILARLADYYHVSMDYIVYRTDSQEASEYETPPYNVPLESLRVADKK